MKVLIKIDQVARSEQDLLIKPTLIELLPTGNLLSLKKIAGSDSRTTISDEKEKKEILQSELLSVQMLIYYLFISSVIGERYQLALGVTRRQVCKKAMDTASTGSIFRKKSGFWCV